VTLPDILDNGDVGVIHGPAGIPRCR
jgi:hypothetical protein